MPVGTCDVDGRNDGRGEMEGERDSVGCKVGCGFDGAIVGAADIGASSVLLAAVDGLLDESKRDWAATLCGLANTSRPRTDFMLCPICCSGDPLPWNNLDRLDDPLSYISL